MNYKIGGTALSTYASAVRIETEQFPAPAGSPAAGFGVDGDRDIERLDTPSYSLMLETILLDSPSFHENKQAVAKLLYAHGDVWLQRTLPDATEVEIRVRPVGPGFSGTMPKRFSVYWPLRPVDPFWRNQTPRTAVNPIASITVAGDAPVGDAVYTFTGGTTPVLTNTTNGDVLTLTGSPGGTPVVVDVGARTITQGGADWDSNFQPSEQRWMRLEPGVNAMTLTGAGSVAVTLYEKYR